MLAGSTPSEHLNCRVGLWAVLLTHAVVKVCVEKHLMLHITPLCVLINDIVETHCYVLTTSEVILMSAYVAESTDCRMFRHIHRPSSTAYKTYPAIYVYGRCLLTYI